MIETTGKGSLDAPLDPTAIEEICARALSALDLRGKRVLVLIPDHTRHAPIGVFFRALHRILGGSVQCLDYLVCHRDTPGNGAGEALQAYRITAEEHRSIIQEREPARA